MNDTQTRRDPFGFDPAHVAELYAEYASDRPVPQDWPSEIVRRAAQQLQDLAVAATPGPWVSLDNGDRLVHDPGHDLDKPVYVVDEPMSNSVNAEYIAALHPIVAVRIAEAWKDQADDMASGLGHLHTCAGLDGFAVYDERETYRADWTATLRAALAYLREDAPKAVA